MCWNFEGLFPWSVDSFGLKNFCIWQTDHQKSKNYSVYGDDIWNQMPLPFSTQLNENNDVKTK